TAQAVNYSNIGETYRALGDNQLASQYYHAALNLDKQIGNKAKIAVCFNNIGLISLVSEDYEQALQYFFKAIEYSEKAENKINLANYFHNIGLTCFAKEDYQNAEKYFLKSIKLKEELRKNAEGIMRIKYLAQEMDTYENLITTYCIKGEPQKGYFASEKSKAQYLYEQLVNKTEYNHLAKTNFNYYKKNLKTSDAVISYQKTDFGYIVFFYTKELFFNIYLLYTSNQKQNQNTNTDYLVDYKDALHRGLKKKKQKQSTDYELPDFEQNLRQYVELLKEDQSPNQQKKKLASFFYQSLFSYFEEYLGNKKNILILPDGDLAFLPFETLIDNQGKYLIEKYNIRYCQSMAVLDVIKNQTNKKPKKSILAFGGAIYSNDQTDNVNELNPINYEYTRNYLYENQDKRNLKKIYQTIGIQNWSPLPGTLIEVNNIKAIYKKATIKTKTQASEDVVKSMSAKGELSQYQVIHFATHGLVLPEIPELSAIVLSQNQNDQEDGYLRVDEITQLKINADFVNLSACDTGLGKIYQGEGVIGLTQSFLIAGAKGISVSLWPISDEGTKEFMTSLYQLVKKENISYAEAISRIKRKFIKDSQFNNPFYWAPFVYYGQ
ncbi:MAG: CHAT domain-containing protein, partial [Spirochaetes bacterium]|nr:CHAT domain-containing protein [Spirochaetota bacterium]